MCLDWRVNTSKRWLVGVEVDDGRERGDATRKMPNRPPAKLTPAHMAHKLRHQTGAKGSGHRSNYVTTRYTLTCSIDELRGYTFPLKPTEQILYGRAVSSNLFQACHIHQPAHLLHQAGCLHPNKLAHIQTKSNASDEALKWNWSYQPRIPLPV